MRLLLLSLLFLQALFANQYEKSGTKIIDIGASISGVQPIEVPKEWVYFDGAVVKTNNTIALEKRIQSSASCVVDNLGRENCTIDQVECDGSQQIDNGVIAGTLKGRKMVHSICPTHTEQNGAITRLNYNPATGYCEKNIVASYARLPANTRFVGRQAADLGLGYIGSSRDASFKNFYFTIEKHSRFGPVRIDTNGIWKVYLNLEITRNGSYYKTVLFNGSRDSGWPINKYLPGVESIVLPPGNYFVRHIGGQPIAGDQGRWRSTFAFMLVQEPCADGGVLGSPSNPPPKTNPSLCYKDSLIQEKPTCPSGYSKTTSDDNCAAGGAFSQYVCTKNPNYGKNNTIGPMECKRDYFYAKHSCKNDTNIYGYGWNGPKLPDNDCKGECGSDNCSCEDIRPADNCTRGMYLCPTDPAKLCTKQVIDGNCARGESVEEIQYRTLNKPLFIGSHRASEYGRVGSYHCGDNCGMNIQWIEGKGNKLCVGNGIGEENCFSTSCSFNGRIDASVDGNNGAYLSGFSVDSDLMTITNASRTWTVCDSNLNCSINQTPVSGSITSNCKLLGSVGNRQRTGGMTAILSNGGKLTFWDSYLDGEVGSIELVPQIPDADKKLGFKYQKNGIQELLDRGFSAIYTIDGYTWALSGNQITTEQCAASEGNGFYRESSNPQANSRVQDPSKINLPIGNSYCLLSKSGDQTISEEKLSKRIVMRDACDSGSGKVRHFCSPHICNSMHQCSVQDCPDGYIGNMLPKEIKVDGECTEQRCDGNLPFIEWCGTPYGCPDGAISTRDGCYIMDCKDAEFDRTSGKCKTWGCPNYSVPKNGRCFR